MNFEKAIITGMISVVVFIFLFVQVVTWDALMFYCINRTMKKWFRWTVILPLVPLLILAGFTMAFLCESFRSVFRRKK